MNNMLLSALGMLSALGVGASGYAVGRVTATATVTCPQLVTAPSEPLSDRAAAEEAITREALRYRPRPTTGNKGY